MVKFGMPIWYGSSPAVHGLDFVEKSRRTLLQNVEKAARLGFDYVEMSLDYPWPDIIHAKTAKEVSKLGKALGIGFAFHAPWAGIGLAHPRQEMHKASLKVIAKCIQAASRFGEPLYFNVHILTEEAPTLEFEEVVAVVANNAKVAVREIAEMCSGKGMDFTVENNTGMLFGLSGHLDFLLAGSKAGLCLDVAHVARVRDELAGAGLKDRSISGWISHFSKKIKVCHLNDYKGGRDNLALGKGTINVGKIVADLRKKTKVGYVLLEEFWTNRRKGAVPDNLRAKNLCAVKGGFGI